MRDRQSQAQHRPVHLARSEHADDPAAATLMEEPRRGINCLRLTAACHRRPGRWASFARELTAHYYYPAAYVAWSSLPANICWSAQAHPQDRELSRFPPGQRLGTEMRRGRKRCIRHRLYRVVPPSHRPVTMSRSPRAPNTVVADEYEGDFRLQTIAQLLNASLPLAAGIPPDCAVAGHHAAAMSRETCRTIFRWRRHYVHCAIAARSPCCTVPRGPSAAVTLMRTVRPYPCPRRRHASQWLTTRSDATVCADGSSSPAPVTADNLRRQRTHGADAQVSRALRQLSARRWAAQ